MTAGQTLRGLGVDIGSSKLVAATLPLGDEHSGKSLPVLVRNSLSNDSTPLAVVFGSGFHRELGEAAADTPASNAANLVRAFVPRLGAPGAMGACSIPTVVDGEAVESVRLEQVLAMLLKRQPRNLKAQTSLGASHLVLAVPPALAAQPGGIAAVQSAAKIADGARALLPEDAPGSELPVVNTKVCTSTSALAYHYAERHAADLAAAAQPTTVLIVDVGHLACSAVVARFSPIAQPQEGEAGMQIQILAEGGNFEVGGGVFDGVLSSHLTAQLVKEHGTEACSGTKFRFRLDKACERLKTLLSTVDPAKVDSDSLVPDKDCRLVVTRKEWDAMLAPSLAHLHALLDKVLADSGVEAAALAGVEVVGGGSRVPCVQELIARSAKQSALRHTLDSSAAVALGAAGMCKLLEKGNHVALTVCGHAPWVDVVGEEMCGAELEAAVALEARFEQQERVEQERGAARNALETWVYAMRAALEGPHKTDLDPSAVNATCDRVEDWLWADGADATAEGFATKLADERRAFEEAFPQFCVAEREAAAAKLRREEEEEEALTRAAAEEAASGEKDDHDNRVLKFSDRYALAEKNKVEGTELFKGGNFQPAAQRYIKALGHLAKLVHVEASMREEEHEQARALRVGCYNNLAMCFLKLELWAKAKDNASHVVELEPSNCKALFRRAQAQMQLREFDLALADLVLCLQIEPSDSAVVKLKAQAEKEIEKEKLKAKKMYGKMFG